MKNKKLKTAAAILLALALLLSLWVLILEAEHDCSGESCAICELLRTCAARLKLLALVLSAVMAALLLSHTAFRFRESMARSRAQRSLVSLKVKLSN